MKSVTTKVVFSTAFLLIVSIAGTREQAQAELHWQAQKKEPLHVRLIALALALPHSSFFANEEIFVAEKQLSEGESRLVKLVFGFLPYQPPLSEYGLDYSEVHELNAMRDPNCDETLSQLTASEPAAGQPPERPAAQPRLKYSSDAPMLDLERHRANLPCYITTPEDFTRSVREPLDREALPSLR